MRSSKFELILPALLFASPVAALERFSPKACLEANYTTRIAHKGPLFGLLTHELLVEKKNCVIIVRHRRYLPKEWVIDVCREPVHIKASGATGVEVSKKVEDCRKADKTEAVSDFCSQYRDLMDVIQDDGLIFAEGDRDSLHTPHGKTYCAYLLIERYLADGTMFSRYTDVPELFNGAKPPKEPSPPSSDAAPAAEAPAAAATPPKA